MSFITLAFNLGGRTQTQVGWLLLDALISEDTQLTGQVTRYPVERKTGHITDNITNESEVLSIVGSITGSSTMVLGGAGRSKLISAKDAIRRIREGRVPITVTTGMEVYENMGLENARISRTGPLERIEVSLELRKMIFVQLRTADVPPEKAADKAKGKAGSTDTKVGKNPGNTTSPTTIERSKADVLIFGKGG